ncbi:MAG: hypothetical protein VX791_18320 [Pseudomonadota bacterium]|nr:hypothetical protein [Pseudomonadota bacterium]
MKALQAARHARDAEFLRVLDDVDDAQAFARLVDHPYLLPLAELVTNKCTSLVGARILIENILASPSDLALRQPIFFGVRVETIEVTNVSRTELTASLSELCTPRQAEAFLEAVSTYQCVDNGYGIVPAASLLEEEIRESNTMFLRRIVLISSGKTPFPESALLAAEAEAREKETLQNLNVGRGKGIIDLRGIRRA